VKNLLTGAAQPVTDTNERIRKLFENRPFNAPSQPERQNRPRKTFTKAAAEENEKEEEVMEDDTRVVEDLDEEAAEADTPEADEAPFIEDDAQEE